MLKWWKFGGVTVGAGVVIGLSVAGWLYMHRDDVEQTDSTTKTEKTAPVSEEPLLGGNSGGASGGSSGSDGLKVVSGGDQGMVQGQSIGGGGQAGSGAGGGTGGAGNAGTTGGGSGDASGSSADQLPTPSQFEVYDKYKNNATALYIDVKPGDGKAIAAGSAVTIQYRGWLTNGKEFDESYDRGKPFTFTEGGGSVIEGMTQAMFGMKAGGQRRLIIPPAVGYGATGHDPIPPDSLLIFDVELESVQ